MTAHAAWYEILEVQEGASWEEVKIAYKRAASEYHPDKAASLPTGFQQYADERMKAINAAYEVAQRLHATRSVEGLGREEPRTIQPQPHHSEDAMPSPGADASPAVGWRVGVAGVLYPFAIWAVAGVAGLGCILLLMKLPPNGPKMPVLLLMKSLPNGSKMPQSALAMGNQLGLWHTVTIDREGHLAMAKGPEEAKLFLREAPRWHTAQDILQLMQNIRDAGGPDKMGIPGNDPRFNYRNLQRELAVAVEKAVAGRVSNQTIEAQFRSMGDSWNQFIHAEDPLYAMRNFLQAQYREVVDFYTYG